jgi:4'-phosphopantetheinyl transferase
MTSLETIVVTYLTLDSVGPAQNARFLAVIDHDERAIADRFIFEADRRAYLAAHGLLRLTLSTFVGVPPLALRFGRSAFGKPFLLGQRQGANWHFNLSHTRDCVAIVLAQGTEVGVDVESTSAHPVVDAGIAEYFFACDEVAYLKSSVSEAQQGERFLTFWSLKEAVVKASGKGLSQPLDGFSIRMNPLRVDFHVESGAQEPWCLAHWQIGERHIAAAARGFDVRFQLEPFHMGAVVGFD